MENRSLRGMGGRFFYLSVYHFGKRIIVLTFVP